MNCMKCGKEIPENAVFCPECLKGMESYPIAPGTHVQLPKRPAKAPEKKNREQTPAEQIASLKLVVRWMLVTIGVLVAAVAILSLLLLHRMNTPNQQPVTGRNYTIAPR